MGTRTANRLEPNRERGAGFTAPDPSTYRRGRHCTVGVPSPLRTLVDRRWEGRGSRRNGTLLSPEHLLCACSCSYARICTSCRVWVECGCVLCCACCARGRRSAGERGRSVLTSMTTYKPQ